MSGNWFRLFRVVNPVKLYHCFGHWLCKKLELSSVGLPFSKFGTDQLCWAVKFLLQTVLAPCAFLSVVLILFSLLVLLSEAAASRKTLMSQSAILITRYKNGTIIFWEEFFKKCHLQIISLGQWWTKKNHPFLESTYQNCMIFAKIGDGPCNYYQNEVWAGVICLSWHCYI